MIDRYIIYIYMCVCVFTHTYIHTYIHTYFSMYRYIAGYRYFHATTALIHTYTYISLSVFIHIYTYMVIGASCVGRTYIKTHSHPASFGSYLFYSVLHSSRCCLYDPILHTCSTWCMLGILNPRSEATKIQLTVAGNTQDEP